MLSFFVDAVPVPKGNMTAYPRVAGRCKACRPGVSCRRRSCVNGWAIAASVSYDNNDELKTWEALIHVKALSERNLHAWPRAPAGVALGVYMTFLMPRPKNHHTPSGALSAEGKRYPFPVTRPDGDKLCRAVADAMTDVLYEDDSQIVDWAISEVWAGKQPGVAIDIVRIEKMPDRVRDQLTRLGLHCGQDQGTLV